MLRSAYKKYYDKSIRLEVLQDFVEKLLQSQREVEAQVAAARGLERAVSPVAAMA